MITRSDLEIDWRPLYGWAKMILHNHDEPHSLVCMSRLVKKDIPEERTIRIRYHFSVISNIRCSVVSVNVVTIFLHHQLRNFLMNFVRIFVHSIQHFLIQFGYLNHFYRFICHRNYTTRVSSEKKSVCSNRNVRFFV